MAEEMSHRQKMQNGFAAAGRDAELLTLYNKCRELLDKYNSTPNSDNDVRQSVLKELFGSMGQNVGIEKPFFCDYGANISIGDYSFLNFNCVLLDCAQIKIGHHTLIGPNVGLYTPVHPHKVSERFIYDAQNDKEIPVVYAKPITIGNHVWIGGSAVILPGVTIGDNAIIGAGSVVTKDVPPNTMVAGNPACFIRHIDNGQ